MVRASVEEVPKLKVPELKAELKAYGLDVKGKKAELSARLLEVSISSPQHLSGDTFSFRHNSPTTAVSAAPAALTCAGNSN